MLQPDKSKIFMYADARGFSEFPAQIVRTVACGFGNVRHCNGLHIMAADKLCCLYNLPVSRVDMDGYVLWEYAGPAAK